VRNLVGADPQAGSIAVERCALGADHTISAARCRGRDGRYAALLVRARKHLYGATIYRRLPVQLPMAEARVCSVRPINDAQMIQKNWDRWGWRDFFCNGEIGPGGKTEFPAWLYAIAGAIRQEVAIG